jgi:DNA-binding NarL/FixJ family response regulator
MGNASEKAKKIRVLLLGGLLGTNLSIKSNLETYDAEIELFTAFIGEEGISKVNTLRPDVILIDHGAPDMNAIEIVKRIRTASTSIKIITMSMSNNPAFIGGSLEAGADGYSSLPLVGDELYSQIYNLYYGIGMSLKQYLDSQKKADKSKN